MIWGDKCEVTIKTVIVFDVILQKTRKGLCFVPPYRHPRHMYSVSPADISKQTIFFYWITSINVNEWTKWLFSILQCSFWFRFISVWLEVNNQNLLLSCPFLLPCITVAIFGWIFSSQEGYFTCELPFPVVVKQTSVEYLWHHFPQTDLHLIWKHPVRFNFRFRVGGSNEVFIVDAFISKDCLKDVVARESATLSRS